MSPTDREALHALLAQMRTLHAELTDHQVGISVLHLEAAIAALESHLRRNGVPFIEELRLGLAAASVAKQTRDATE